MGCVDFMVNTSCRESIRSLPRFPRRRLNRYFPLLLLFLILSLVTANDKKLPFLDKEENKNQKSENVDIVFTEGQGKIHDSSSQGTSVNLRGYERSKEDLHWQVLDIEEWVSYGDTTTTKVEGPEHVDSDVSLLSSSSLLNTIDALSSTHEMVEPPALTTMQAGSSNTCKLRLSVYIAPAQFASISGQIYWTLYTPFGPTATFPGALREFVRGMTYSVQVTLNECYGELIAVRGDLRKTSVELLIGNIKVDVLYPYQKSYRTETPDNISLIPPYPTTVALQEYAK